MSRALDITRENGAIIFREAARRQQDAKQEDAKQEHAK
jgi:hypothetical protein